MTSAPGADPDRPGPHGLSPAKRALYERLRPASTAPSVPGLSFAQQRMWLMEQAEPQRVHHTIRAVELRGELDLGALERALAVVVDRHEALRTGVVARGGTPDAVLLPAPTPALDVVDGGPDAPVRDLVEAFARRPFDLAREIPVRARVWRLDDDQHVLAVVIHHLASDEGSRAVLWRDLTAAYASATGHPAVAGPPTATPYREFVSAQRRWLDRHGDAELAHWTARLAGVPQVSTIPPTRRVTGTGPAGSTRHRRRLESSEAAGLRAVARAERATTFMACLAVYAWIVRQWSGEPVPVFGMLVSGRGEARFHDTVGLFVNTVAVPVDTSGEPTFRELLGRVRRAVVEALDHQELPFERVVEAVVADRVPGRHPLFQLMVNGTRDARTLPAFPGLAVTAVEVSSGAVDVDFGVLFAENGDDLEVVIDHRDDLYDDDTARVLLDQFAAVTAAVAADPDRPLDAALLLTDADRSAQAAVNATAGARPAGTVVDLVLDQAARTPRAPALADEEHDWLPYAELARRVERLARLLARHGIGSGHRVALCLDRSVDMVVAVLGVQRAGAAYVPLDPSYPRERLEVMAEDSACALVLTDSAHRHLVPAVAEVLELDSVDLDALDVGSEHAGTERADSRPDQPDHPDLPARPGPDDIAYVIYTSGSTGRPKGVVVAHRGVANRIAWGQRTHPLDARDTVLQKTPFSFDVSVWEMLWPLTAGARLFLAAPGGHRDPRYLARVIRDRAVTVTHFVPSMLDVFLDVVEPGSTPTLRRVMVSGEALGEATRDRFAEVVGVSLVNLYGPTEASIEVTWAEQRHDPQALVTIGRPIANTTARVLDERLGELPAGVPGELHLGGVCLAEGYLGRPDLTAERFVTHPVTGERLYRTGDLVRWTPDHEIQYLGRTDDQVKVRGLRVELGEIDGILASHPAVAAAATVLVHDRQGDPVLVAHVVPVRGVDPIDPADLLDRARRRLPAALVPARVLVRAALPLSPAGKLDRAALAAATPTDPERAAARARRAAGTALETAVARCWANVLATPEPDVDDDFFASGGHSLAAARFAAAIERATGRVVPLAAVFAYPTVGRLAAHLEREDRPVAPAPTPCGRSTGRFPLSPAQERMLFLEELAETSSLYGVRRVLRVAAALDSGALTAALGALALRHAALRTTVRRTVDGPVQDVQAVGVVPLHVVDLRADPDPEIALRRDLAAQADVPFELAVGPLVRARLYHLPTDDSVLLLHCSHLVVDATSLDVLVGELAALYDHHATGDPVALDPVPLQFPDVAVWQRDTLTHPSVTTSLAYWVDALTGAPEITDLPTDRPRPALRDHRGGRAVVVFGAERTAALDAVARRLAVTPFAVLHAAAASLLVRLNGAGDITIGSPVAGRDHTELAGTVGLMVNTVVLRSRPDLTAGFADEVRASMRTVAAAQEHQAVPFEAVVEALAPRRDTSRNPLFQVMINLAPGDDGLRFAGAPARPLDVDPGQARFDLSFGFAVRGGEMQLALDHSLDVFDTSTAERLARRYLQFLDAALAAPDTPTGRLPVLLPDEVEQLSRWGAGNVRPVPAGTTLDRILEVASRNPTATAVVDDRGVLDYAGLVTRVRHVAHRLLAAGVAPGDHVAVAVPRGAELVVASLATWWVGAAFLPLDPSFPADRLRWTAEDAGAQVVVGDGGPVAGLDGLRRVSCAPVGPTAPEPPRGVSPGPSAADAAYVIYTSGSTGRPKGVVVEHGALLNLLSTMAERPGLAAADVLLAVTTYSFDIALLELFLPLVVGATVVIASARTASDPHLMGARADEVGATVLQATPSTWRMLVGAGWPLRARLSAWSGGEPLGPELAAALRPRVAELWNLYGPTETTIWSTVDRIVDGPVTVGRPVANTVARVTDARGELLPPGTVGELVLGGAGVARGYWGRPELTAERFVDLDGVGRAYRTGDLARWRQDGRLDLLGRVDHQVKVRGHRVELGEIEAALTAQPGVEEAVVGVMDRGEGDQRLVAHVVGRGSLDPGGLTAALRRHLPAYMVPSHVVVLDAMPRTRNLKVDRSQLPAPMPTGARQIAAPSSDVERTVVELCAELLGVGAVSPSDDFFQIGGHSLLAATLVTRLSQRYDVRVALHTVFETPVLRDLAAAVEAARGDPPPYHAPPDPRAGRRLRVVDTVDPDMVELALHAGAPTPPGDVPVVDVLPVSAAQRRMWMLHALAPDAATYHLPLLRRVDGPVDTARLARAVARLVERHEVLRTRYVRHAASLVQVVDAAAEVPLEVVERPGTGWDELASSLRELAARPFDLGTGPVVRAALVRVEPEVAYLLLTVHHVAADGGSLPVLLADLARAYADPELVTGPPAVRFGDVAIAEDDRLRRRPASFRLDAQFWQDTLAGAPPTTELPLDRPRPVVAGVAGGRRRRRLDDHLAAGVDDLARAAGGTAFMVLTAAVASLLSRHGAGPDLVLGVPTAGRDFPGADQVVGPLINTVPVRIDTGGDPDFATVVDRVVAASSAAFAHSGLAFESMLDLVDTGHHRGTHPLFQVMVSGRREAGAAIRLGAATAAPVALDWGLARYDLTFVVDTVGADRTVAVEYSADLFDASTAGRLLDRLVVLLEHAVADPTREVGELDLLDPTERRLLAALATEAPVPAVHRSWPEAVRSVAAIDPDRTAVTSGADRLTFGELVRSADVLAARLVQGGIARGDIVALAIGHRVEWLVGVLAVWTAGAAYLAVDPTYPERRTVAAIEEAGCRVVLRHAAEPAPTGLPAGCETVVVDAASLLTTAPGAPVTAVVPDPGDLAYVIYTSGSTGHPKGSLVEHGQLAALVHSLHAALPDPGRLRVHAVNAPLAFDASVQQLVHLAWGNTLDLVPDDVRRDPRETVRYVRRHRIDVLDCTPTHLRLLMGAGLLERADHPAVLLVGGEAVEPDLWDTLRGWPGTALNCYGPTEVTVQATVASVASSDRPTLGRPLAGVRVRVLDPRGRLVPPGVTGELWLGGPQVTRGYLQRELLTRERFVTADDGSRWYRTGDLVRIDGHGRLEFRGRLDDQVKVRGHRIELGEIDAVFAALPGVAAAAAVVVDRAGEKDLAVHVVPAAGTRSIDARALRQAARDRLPPSMVPRWIVLATAIPQTPAGKTDRERLRLVDPTTLENAGAPDPGGDGDPARELVRGLWADVLGHRDFADHDDFFDVGGNSLLAIAVVANLRDLEIDLPLTVMFDRPTVTGIGDLVAEHLLADAAVPATDGGAR